jgi:hypothetical protein
MQQWPSIEHRTENLTGHLCLQKDSGDLLRSRISIGCKPTILTSHCGNANQHNPVFNLSGTHLAFKQLR